MLDALLSLNIIQIMNGNECDGADIFMKQDGTFYPTRQYQVE